MIEEAAILGKQDLASLSDTELAGEIRRRTRIVEKWKDTYWTEFIPFAHGARLFGQIYNDNVRPSDPYQFVDLLSDSGMVSVERNRMLEALADRVRESPDLASTSCGRERSLPIRALPTSWTASSRDSAP